MIFIWSPVRSFRLLRLFLLTAAAAAVVLFSVLAMFIRAYRHDSNLNRSMSSWSCAVIAFGTKSCVWAVIFSLTEYKQLVIVEVCVRLVSYVNVQCDRVFVFIRRLFESIERSLTAREWIVFICFWSAIKGNWLQSASFDIWSVCLMSASSSIRMAIDLKCFASVLSIHWKGQQTDTHHWSTNSIIEVDDSEIITN